MPYFITDKSPDCSGWATIKEDGEVIGCHETKQDAINQMVAVSIAEDMEPGGERAPAPPEDQITVSDKNPAGSAAGKQGGIEINEATETALKNKVADHNEKMTEEDRQVSLEIPVYIRTAARKGLDYYGQGLAGEGLVDRTVREARDLARGDITEDKVIRSNAWAQRHAVDLEAPKNSDANNDQFPGAGAVAHYLWGINPLNPQPARDWYERKANAIKDERGLFNFYRAKTEYFANIPGMEDNKVETRRIQVNEFELRAGPTGDGMSFTGYAAVFNSDSEPLPFIERIAQGAFKKSLKSRQPIKMYMNHDSSMLLASTRSRTLRLEEDSKGLLVNADLPDTTVGRDLSVLMQRGDVDSMSFGFSVPAGGDSWSDNGMTRELRQVRLHEVSVVTGFPAYKATSASVRSLDLLAKRTGVDADKLAEAITMLESGNTLSDESAELLSSAVSKLRAEPAQVPASVNILSKHLELLKSF